MPLSHFLGHIQYYMITVKYIYLFIMRFIHWNKFVVIISIFDRSSNTLQVELTTIMTVHLIFLSWNEQALGFATFLTIFLAIEVGKVMEEAIKAEQTSDEFGKDITNL